VAGRASSLIGAGGRQTLPVDKFAMGHHYAALDSDGRRTPLHRFSNYAAPTARSLTRFRSPTVINFPERTETVFNLRLQCAPQSD